MRLEGLDERQMGKGVERSKVINPHLFQNYKFAFGAVPGT